MVSFYLIEFTSAMGHFVMKVSKFLNFGLHFELTIF